MVPMNGRRPYPRSVEAGPARHWSASGASLPGWATGCFVWLAIVMIVILDRQRPATESLAVHGLIDEMAHVLTATIVALAFRSLDVAVSLAWALIGGVILDSEHILQLLGWTDAIPGSSRGGGHSLLVVAIVLLVSVADGTHRIGWISLAVGMASHLFRDMATGTVALLWPFDATPLSIRHDIYLATLAWCSVMVLVGVVHAWNRKGST